jgi:hypothetical protein
MIGGFLSNGILPRFGTKPAGAALLLHGTKSALV